MQYVSTVRGREKRKVALRQMNEVSRTLRCALDLCFHVTSQCVCYYFDGRLKGQKLDWAWPSPNAAGTLPPEYLGRGLEVGIAQHVTSPATAAVAGSQPGSSSGTSAWLLRCATQGSDRVPGRDARLVLAIHATLSFHTWQSQIGASEKECCKGNRN